MHYASLPRLPRLENWGFKVLERGSDSQESVSQKEVVILGKILGRKGGRRKGREKEGQGEKELQEVEGKG